MEMQKRILEVEQKFIDLLRKPVKTQAEIQQMEEIRRELEKQLRLETKELLNDLEEVGLKVVSVYDLVNTSASYKEAIPILVKHLSIPYHPKSKEGIVRALAVKEAKGIACKPILEEYYKTPKEDDNYRWILGNTMRVIVTKDYINEIIDIVLNEDNGESRQMFVVALSKLKHPETKKVLQQLLDDSNELIRKEAQKALKKIS